MSVNTTEKGHPGGFESSFNPVTGRARHSVTSSYDLARELQFPDSLVTYDRMRADPQVAGVLEALAQPILNAEWDLVTDGVPEDVVRLVRTELGLYTPDEPLAQAMHQGVFITDHIAEMTQTMLWAGFSPAEVIWNVAPPTPAQEGIEAGVDGEIRHLRKLAPRPPRTITGINVEKDGGLKSITQTSLKTTEDDQEIKVRDLVFYSHNKIGGSWEGQSILRPCYRPWAMKDMYLRLDMRAAELHSSGIWRGKTTDSRRRDVLLEKLAQLRNGEESAIVHDPADEVELMSTSGTLLDVVARIKYFDQEISRSALAMFLDLGHDNGARSLGETHLRVFITKVQAIADYIARVVTQHVIGKLVRLNFPEGTAVPAITPGDLNAQMGTSAETLQTLLGSGAITWDKNLEQYARERNGLPERDPDAPDPNAKPETPAVQVVPDNVTDLPVAVAATEVERATDTATDLYQRLLQRVGA